MSIHEGFMELAAASVDFELDEYDRAELHRHLAGCPACRATAEALRDDAAAIESEPRPRLSPARSEAILRDVLRPQRRSPSLRLVAVAALAALAADGAIPASTVTDAIARYDIDPDKLDPARA